ncbi:protein FAR1-RELATED SEQUENCE 5-like [Arachis ipaensis]|uniref:protein FAR1-RELATED SEQUENCE 5-like n=1 Tax=Arachis ipaensis TaxID=130454 RepID=UPI0007AF1413|nr:protein FAR1-RELATED SEQUENCE 5-like [Arachis ipaensis]XP_025661752.1 protein FAR1-RELATED SEQUENCE 5-like [Arachis hypogaea]
MELFGGEIGKQASWVVGVPPVRHRLKKVVRVDLNIMCQEQVGATGISVALAVTTFIEHLGMDSGSEGNSNFSGQWTDGWSSDSDEEEVWKGDEGGTVPSSESLSGSGDQISDYVKTSMLSNVVALDDAEFHGVEEAYAIYVVYEKATGFAIRKSDSIKDDEGNVVRKFFYCNRHGLREKKHYEKVDRKRAHKTEITTNCNAKFVVFLDKQSGKWRMKTFVQDHNHDLALPALTNVMLAHCNINEGDKAHIHSMHEAGFQTSQIKGIFPYLSGGYRNVHFIKKDFYNYIDDVRHSRIVQRDAQQQSFILRGKLRWIH